MTDISDQIDDSQKRAATQEGYEGIYSEIYDEGYDKIYGLEKKHFIPFAGFKTYTDTFPITSEDPHFLEGFNASQRWGIRSRRLNESALLVAYNVFFVAGAITLFGHLLEKI